MFTPMPRSLSFVSLLTVAGWSAIACAEHEPDHRYVVIGYVRDGSGKPAENVEVRAVREKTGAEQRARSDADGFFLLVVHLHTEDLGDALRVTANGASLRISATFDPLDVISHRGTRVDFLGNQPREHQDLFRETLQRYLAQ